MPAWTSASFASAPATLASATSTAASACFCLAIACSTAACFCSSLRLQLGHRQLGEHLALLDRSPMLTVQLLHVAGDLGVDRRGLERLDLARLADAAADGLPLGPDDLDPRRRPARTPGPPASSDGRSQPAAMAARTRASDREAGGRIGDMADCSPDGEFTSREVSDSGRSPVRLGPLLARVVARLAARRWPRARPARGDSSPPRGSAGSPGRRGRARPTRGRALPWTSAKTAGSTIRVATVAAASPPMTARPSGAVCSPPSPKPSAIGTMPAIMAQLVIRIGRSRPLAPVDRGLVRARPPPRGGAPRRR